MYCATRPKDVPEVLTSIGTLRRHHPQDRIVVYASEPDDRLAATGAEYRSLSTLRHSFADKIQAIVDEVEHGPGDLVIFLDGDTWVVEDIEPAIELMDRFDIAAAHAPRRITREYEDVPPSFPELNTGVLLIRRSHLMRQLLGSWLTAFLADAEAGSVPPSQDQPSLRRLLHHSTDIRLAVLPPEYNCRFNMGVSVDGKVRILHGRSPTLREIADCVNVAPADRHHGGPTLRTIRDEVVLPGGAPLKNQSALARTARRVRSKLKR